MSALRLLPAIFAALVFPPFSFPPRFSSFRFIDLFQLQNSNTVTMKLSRCLHDLGITDASIFEECDDVNDEFKVIRKIYLKKALLEHPVSTKQQIEIEYQVPSNVSKTMTAQIPAAAHQ